MIQATTIQIRLEQLQNERQGLQTHVDRLQTELAQAMRMIHGYDGAIGELALLIQGDEGEPSSADDGDEMM